MDMKTDDEKAVEILLKHMDPIDPPNAKMPSHQLDLFLDQAMHRQYQVALFFDQDRPPFIGRITRPLGEKRYLVKAYHSNVYRIITEAEVSYIKRFK